MQNRPTDYSVDTADQAMVVVDEMLRRIQIRHLEIDNQDAFNLLVSQETEAGRVDELRSIIDIGSFVKTKVQMVMDTDYIDLRVSEMTSDFGRGIDQLKDQIIGIVGQHFDPAKSDSYTDRINKFFERKKAEFETSVRTALADVADAKEQIATSIDESFNPELKTSHLSKLMETIDGFETQLADNFDDSREGSIAHHLKGLVTETLGADGALVKAIDRRFSFDNPQSTIATLQANLMKKLEEIKTEVISSKAVSEAEKAAAKKSAQKGYTFEEDLFAKLEAFAESRSDVVLDVSTTSGDITKSKKGDFLYKVTALGKAIAIEAKNRDMGTPTRLIQALDQTKVNRKADYVVYIAAEDDQLHRQVGIFQEYLPDKIITHVGL